MTFNFTSRVSELGRGELVGSPEVWNMMRYNLV